MWWRRSRTPEVTAPAPSPIARLVPDALLRRLQWTILRPLATVLGGEERSLLYGPGMELAEVREYQPGDDIRYIDWNITARTDRPHIRETHAERAIDVWLVIDRSASVDWGTAQCRKRDRAVEFAAVAGQLLARHGNRIGALPFADRPLAPVPPGSGRQHLLQLLAQLEAPLEHRRARTDLGAALKQLNIVVRRRSLILVVTDFLVKPEWQQAMGQLAQRHEVVAVSLRDPREAALPDIGLVALEDPETGGQMIVDTGDRRLRERFATAAQAQATQLQQELAHCGVDQLVLSTDEALLPPLVRFLNARRLRRTIRAPVAQRTKGNALRVALS